MRRILLRTIVFAAIVVGWSILVPAQNSRPDLTETFKQLLAMPAPTPAAENTAKDSSPKKEYPPSFYSDDHPPADDAPIEDLVEYWLQIGSNGTGANASETVALRLLEVCADDSEKLRTLVSVLPQSEATGAKVKELYEKGLAGKEIGEYTLEKMKEWLVLNTRYFLSELAARAGKVKDHEKNGSVDRDEELTALAQLDWPTAKPILQRLSGGSRRAATLALILFYKHAVAEKDLDGEEQYRTRLRETASDRNAPGQARDAAIEALSATKWSGQDEWYLSLFEDETLILLRDGYSGFLPLGSLLDMDPDKWIPVMTKMVESKNRSIQQTAASCLVRLTVSRVHAPRRDAILPVLRWLSDPDWLKTGSSTDRSWFMQKMSEVEVPESVPGLIWIVENEPSNQTWAARTLAHYKDPRAVPALRRALASARPIDQQFLVEGLLASGGVSEPEQVAALEAYAATLSKGGEEFEKYRLSNDPWPVPLSIGAHLARSIELPDSSVRAVLARGEQLRRTDPQVGNALLKLAHQWQGRQVDLDVIQRIADGSADAAAIAKALERRATLRESVGPEVQSLRGSSDLAQGVAPVLLDDNALAESVLSGGAETSQIALLLSARLTQVALPVAQVGSLMKSKNQLLAAAAEQYLLADDREDSRALLWQYHPNQAFITGWRDNIEIIDGDSLEQIARNERKLSEELFRENAPVEIVALFSTSEVGGSVLRIYADKAIYTRTANKARYYEAVVTEAELSKFKEFIAANNLMNLGPQFGPCHHDCWISEFLSLTKAKGRRVFGRGGFSAWRELLENFALLGRREGEKVHYNLEQEIKGLEVLYADQEAVVKDVSRQGNETRIFVERESTEAESAEKKKLDSAEEDADEATRAELQRRALALRRARYSWRVLTGNKAGALTSQPDGYATFDESKFPLDDLEKGPSEDDPLPQFIGPDSIVFTRNFEGLWRQTAGRKPVRISAEGSSYSQPIATPDGKWVVVAKTDSHWGAPNYIVRFNLQTGREFRVGLAPSDQFDTVAYLAVHGKVLLRRAKDDYETFSKNSTGPDSPEYYLLDASTGLTQKVTGEFAPLREKGKRFLQPTAAPNEFWAAVPNRAKEQTQVGRYNVKDFTFKPLLLVPHIVFESLSMWVDEQADKLYVVYDGDLLRMPLTNRKPGQ
jgi:hypothetical protein